MVLILALKDVVPLYVQAVADYFGGFCFNDGLTAAPSTGKQRVPPRMLRAPFTIGVRSYIHMHGI